MKPKNAFNLVLYIHLALPSCENWLEIESMYLFVSNKIRSKISFVIKQFQGSSSVFHFLHLAELTEVDTEYSVTVF